MKKQIISYWDLAAPDTFKIEVKFLGNILMCPEEITDIKEVITPAHFSNEDAKELWSKIVAMHNNGEYIDFATLYPVLPSSIKKEIVDASSYNAVTLSTMAKQLNLCYLKRTAFELGTYAVTLATSNTTTEAELLTIPEAVTRAFDTLTESNKGMTLQEAMTSLSHDLEEGADAKIPTGIRGLDCVFNGGLGKGELVILAARPSVGKTALMLQFAMNMAKAGNYPTIFSLEMRNEDLAKRFALMTEKITPYNFNVKGDEMWAKFNIVDAELSEIPMTLYDNIYNADLINTLIVRKTAKGSKVIFIDYLGLIASNREERNDLRLAAITGGLKRIAKKCGVPIVLLCQLNRDSEKQGRSPELHDLRDSGSIEQDADIVMMLERPEGLEDNDVDVFIRKNRNGVAGALKVELRGKNGYTKFEMREDCV